jgi:ERCC4-related helicase
MIDLIQVHLSEKKNIQDHLETDLSRTMLTTDYRRENLARYHQQSSDYTAFIQSQPLTLMNLQRLLRNIVDVGEELGLAGLFFFARSVRKQLKNRQLLMILSNSSSRQLFEDIFQRFECLVDDILNPLYYSSPSYEILFSPKVIRLIERIVQQQQSKELRSKCIVFVERVHTALILDQVLTEFITTLEEPWDQRLKVKHLTGIKAGFGDRPMTAKYQVKNVFTNVYHSHFVYSSNK